MQAEQANPAGVSGTGRAERGAPDAGMLDRGKSDPGTPDPGTLDRDLLIEMYRRMVLIRAYEDTVNELFLQGKLAGTIHQSQGQEATAVGVCMALRPDDYITTTHRPAGHCIAKGMSVKSMMAEMFGKVTGCCRGKGGSMHLGDLDVGVVPAIAIVAAGVPIAAGIGLAFRMQRKDRVAVAFFGDGAVNNGAFHEGANLAAIWKLPVVLVCENNFYAASTHISKSIATESIAARAAAYGLPAEVVDGNDVLAVFGAARRAVERARRGEGPSFLECQTYRRVGHSRSDPNKYRDREEEAGWLARDPIPAFRRCLAATGVLDEADDDAVHRWVQDAVAEAVAFARQSPDPAPEDALRDVLVNFTGGGR